MCGPVLGGEYDSPTHALCTMVSLEKRHLSANCSDRRREKLLSGKKQDKNYSGIVPFFQFLSDKDIPCDLWTIE